MKVLGEANRNSYSVHVRVLSEMGMSKTAYFVEVNLMIGAMHHTTKQEITKQEAETLLLKEGGQ